MEISRGNPFNITKSVDFTDEEIANYWVDISTQGGFVNLLKPDSPMPMLVLGGKGSGKTHVMRYMSYAVQRIRYGDNFLENLSSDGYIGLYMRCGGLNSGRFKGKGQSEESWQEVFAFQLEIWLAQIVLTTAADIMSESNLLGDHEEAIATGFIELFDVQQSLSEMTIAASLGLLKNLQRQLNIAVNNVALSQRLELSVPVTPGSLVFGVPRLLASICSHFRELNFLYLIDEFENLSEYQQVHVNTLLREREAPSSFRIGGRLYGIKTQLTNSGDEENKEDSEFEKVTIDDRLRKNMPQYRQFAKRLVMKRLVEGRLLASIPDEDDKVDNFLKDSFVQFGSDGLMRDETSFIGKKYDATETPWIKRLREMLMEGLGSSNCFMVKSTVQVDEIVKALSFPEVPILEKLNCFIFYVRGRKDEDAVGAAKTIRSECKQFSQSLDRKSKYGSSFQHYRLDMLAQLLRESDRDLVYAGADTFVDISWGVPRNLLVLFKNIFAWAEFKGEQPFSATPISIAAQVEGVREAANWFFRDSRMTGPDGRLVLDSIHRLGELFREIRYSDKPSECELSTFSFDSSRASDESLRVIDLATKYSLLVETSEQSDRNSERIDRKLQLSRMIAPRWELGINSRGAIVLSGKEINAIFSSNAEAAFEAIKKERIDRMTAPYFGVAESTSSQPSLFDEIENG